MSPWRWRAWPDPGGGPMTNGVAIGLALIIASGLALDYYVYDLEGSLFLARKTLALIDWLAFWR